MSASMSTQIILSICNYVSCRHLTIYGDLVLSFRYNASSIEKRVPFI